MLRSENNVFISDTGFNLVRADKKESSRTVAADVETNRVTAKVISLKSYVERQAPLTSDFVQFSDVFLDAPRRANIRRRRSRRLHTTHAGNRTDMGFDARRIAIVRAPARR